MAVTYRTRLAADPELYGQLVVERYGPLSRLLAERHRCAGRTKLAVEQVMTPSPGSDPDAARRRAELAKAIQAPRPSSQQAPTRTAPYLGATWCNSCDSWCSPAGVCRCNDR